LKNDLIACERIEMTRKDGYYWAIPNEDDEKEIIRIVNGFVERFGWISHHIEEDDLHWISDEPIPEPGEKHAIVKDSKVFQETLDWLCILLAEKDIAVSNSERKRLTGAWENEQSHAIRDTKVDTCKWNKIDRQDASPKYQAECSKLYYSDTFTQSLVDIGFKCLCGKPIEVIHE